MLLVKIKPMGWFLVLLALLIAVAGGFFLSHSFNTTNTASANATPAAVPSVTPSANAPSSSALFSPNAAFTHIPVTSPLMKGAIPANDRKTGQKMINKPILFTGKIVKIFAPAGNNVRIMNFAENYKDAFSAAIDSKYFKSFPDPEKLVGKEVLIKGKIIDFKGQLEVELTSPTQIQLIDR